MRLLPLILLILTCGARAGESLPDVAPMESADDTEAMAQRFPGAPPMDRDAMQNLYLESPIQVRDPEQEGLSSLTPDERYTETDLLFRERVQSQAAPQVPQLIERPTPPPEPAPMPVQAL